MSGQRAQRFTIEERADRFQRRITGPWKTDSHAFGPVAFEHRYRYRPRIENVRFTVAWHDGWTHGVERSLLLPFMRWLNQRLTHRMDNPRSGR